MNQRYFLGLTPDGRRRYACDYWLDHRGVLRPPIAGGAPDSCNDQVDASSDDGIEGGFSGWVNTDWLEIECYSGPNAMSRYWGAVRFHSPTDAWPAQGSTIDEAYAELDISNADHDDPNLDIHAQDAASPTTFVAGDYTFDITSRPRTAASAPWVADGIGTGWKQSPSLVDVIQEIVTDYAVTAIVLIFKPRINEVKTFRCWAWDKGDNSLGVKLHLEWTEGGETFYKSIAGSVTTAGTLARTTSISPAGVFSSSGAVGTVATWFKALAGTLASSGAVGWLWKKALAGTLSASGTLTGKTLKTLAGTLTSAGKLLRKTPTSFAGSLAPTGYLASKLLVGVTYKTLTGALTSSGTLVRKTSYNVAGTLASAGVVLKQKSHGVAGTLASTGAVVGSLWQPKALAGTLSAAGAVVPIAGKALSGALSSSGVMETTLYKFITPMLLQGTLALTGALNGIKLGLESLAGTFASAGAVATMYFRTQVLGGTATFAATLGRMTQITVAGTLAPVGSVAKKTWQAVAGAFAAVGSLIARLWGPGKVIEVAGSVDTTINAIGSVDTLLEVEGSDDTTIDVKGSV